MIKIKELLKQELIQEANLNTALNKIGQYATKYGLKKINLKTAIKLFEEPLDKQEFLVGYADKDENYIIISNEGDDGIWAYFVAGNMSGSDNIMDWTKASMWKQHFG